MKAIVFSLLACVVTFAHGQDYHPLVDTGKLWTNRHQFIYGGPVTSDYIKFEGDTMIGAYMYKFVWRYLNEGMTQKSLDGFIREDVEQKRVFERMNARSDEFLLYDFSAAVGDTLVLRNNPSGYVLDTIDTYTLLSGEQRQSLKLHSTYYSPCYETWVEGIGSITRGVLNSGTCGFVGGETKMLCAWENDTMKYHNPDFTYCFVITSAEEQTGKEPARVFPNPVTDEIRVEIINTSQKDLHFELLDYRGVHLLRQDLISRETLIHLHQSNIPPGIYLYRIVSGNETITTGKLAVL